MKRLPLLKSLTNALILKVTAGVVSGYYPSDTTFHNQRLAQLRVLNALKLLFLNSASAIKELGTCLSDIGTPPSVAVTTKCRPRRSTETLP